MTTPTKNELQDRLTRLNQLFAQSIGFTAYYLLMRRRDARQCKAYEGGARGMASALDVLRRSFSQVKGEERREILAIARGVVNVCLAGQRVPGIKPKPTFATKSTAIRIAA